MSTYKECNEEAGPCPCDGCQFEKRCGTMHLACRHFWMWCELYPVKDIPIENPNRAYYARNFPRDMETPELKSIKAKLIFILKITCNGHGVKAPVVWGMSKRLKFGLMPRQVSANLNIMAVQGLIRRTGTAEYHFN